MPNTFLKPTVIARTALGLLEREIVLPGLIWRDAAGDFAGAANDTVSLRVPGFNVFQSNALPEDVAYAFHRTAYVLGMRAPMVPEGATFGRSESYQGLAMRWIRDYDFINVQDRSLVDTFLGTNIVADGPAPQTVEVTGGPGGGTFTLAVGGQTTTDLAFNASAATVQAALAALSGVNGVTVTKAASTYTVTFEGHQPAIVADATDLTGGVDPGITVTVGAGTLVRSVKITLP